ncbi:MAG TPA: Crp/Fnr family transcriptional regulator [Prolixibacteraceae bacterium]|nr:Crp/Fnr family transcriptional regulator [Prolixibacteraceae bacterium]
MLLNETKQEYSWFRRISMQFISEKDFDKLEKTSVKLNFKKGETILKQGGMPTHIVYLEKGIVKFNYENGSGKNLILTIVSAPKILGGANLFYKDNNLFSLIAVEDCEVVMIDAKVTQEVLMDNSKFAMMMFQVASEMFKKSVMNFISLAHKQKEGRIADIILYLSAEVYHDKLFVLSLTRKELAEFAGCSTENVIMTLSKWQNEKIISLEGKTIEIKDIERLKYISKIG